EHAQGADESATQGWFAHEVLHVFECFGGVEYEADDPKDCRRSHLMSNAARRDAVLVSETGRGGRAFVGGGCECRFGGARSDRLRKCSSRFPSRCARRRTSSP